MNMSMNMSPIPALQWTSALLSLSLVIQSGELLRLAPAFAEQGIWRGSTLREELPALAPLLDHRAFVGLQAMRLAAALALGTLSVAGALRAEAGLPTGAAGLLALLLGVGVFTNVRFRGTFNGGSDFMTLVVLTALLAAALAGPASPGGRLQEGCLWYIAFHVCASYFVAGWIKILKANWRSGRALRGFLSTTIYEPGPVLRSLRSLPAATFALSWGVMLWEIAFPAALFDPRATLVFLALGAAFHLGNVFFFGLNRFFFAWLAAYPAVIFAARSLQGLPWGFLS